MVSLPPISLPIIDISPYLSEKPGDLAKRSLVSAALHKACVQYGFFYLDISSYLDPHEPEELAALAKAFFSLPEEEKDRIALRHGDHARGVGTGRHDYDIIERYISHRLCALEGKCDKRQSRQPRRYRLLQARVRSRQDKGTLGREPVAGYTRLQEQVRGMGGEDEEARVGGYGSVRFA